MKAAPISCIITSYNNLRTLSGAVDSVLNQTLPVAEIIIADDCSIDGSLELIELLASRHSCIRPLLREKNIGVAANRDLAIRSASQPFITHLDGDDLFARDKIRAEWRVLDHRTDAIAYSQIARINTRVFLRSSVLNPSASVKSSDLAIWNVLGRSGPIPRDMLLSKELFMAAGGFTHGVNMYEDWQFKLKLSLTGAEWVNSGALGTLYMQWPGTLSKADQCKHIFWKKQVIRPLIPHLRQRMGRKKLTAVLLKQFNSDAVLDLIGDEVQVLDLVEVKRRNFGDHAVSNWVRFLLRVPEIRRSLLIR